MTCLLRFVLAAAVAGLATCAPVEESSHVLNRAVASTATLREWPCPTTEGGLKTFALQIGDGSFGGTPLPDYNGKYLGVHSNGSMPAHSPVHDDPMVLWYLDGGNLYASPDTVPHAPDVAQAPVVTTLWSPSSPYGGYWQTWVFNTTEYDCQYTPNNCHYSDYYYYCDSKCSPLNCTIADLGDSSYTDGYLECNEIEQSFGMTWGQMESSDAVVGSWINDQSGGGVFDYPGESVFWKIIPSCELPS